MRQLGAGYPGRAVIGRLSVIVGALLVGMIVPLSVAVANSDTPDLVVITPSANATSVETDGTFHLTVTVSNEGQGQAAQTTLAFKQSTDSTIDTSDTTLETATILDLMGLARYTTAIIVEAPAEAGIYHYGACVATVADESDTTNNCSSSVAVTVGTPVMANSQPTGAPTVSGTAQVGETLTATTTGIADTDGLTNVSYSYQWLGDDTAIDGETSSTYAIQDSDNGKVITVRVSFTDDAGNEETLTSAGTAAVASAPINGICDRTQGVQDAILNKLASVSECANVVESDLNGITEIIIKDDYEFTALQNGDFRGLSNLETLSMHRNGLSALPEDVFDGLASLTVLHLYDNKLTTLPSDTFDGLSKLETLTLSYNSLGALPEDVFDSLDSLTELHLGNNSLSTLPEDVFDGLSDLTILDVGSNSLGALPEDLFNDLSGLEQLLLHGNSIGSLPTDLFDGLSGLEKLHLNNNSITSLPTGIFDGLSSLDTLDLFSNEIGSLSWHTFDGLSGLIVLRLEQNQISSLPDGLFNGLTNLRRLELRNNTGAPFTLAAELGSGGDSAVVVKVSQGMPFAVNVTLSAVGGSLSTSTVELSGGSMQSQAVTVTPDAGQTEVAVRVNSAAFKAQSQSGTATIPSLTTALPDQDYFYSGIQVGTGEGMTLFYQPATGAPTISGTAQVGKTLTADTSGIDDADGLDNVSYSYQWLADDAEIDGATSSTYTVQSTDNGKVIKVRVTFTDDGGSDDSLTSSGTSAVVMGGL